MIWLTTELIISLDIRQHSYRNLFSRLQRPRKWFSIDRIHCLSWTRIAPHASPGWCRRPANGAVGTIPSGSPAETAFGWAGFPSIGWNLHCYCYGLRVPPAGNRLRLRGPVRSRPKTTVGTSGLATGSVTVGPTLANPFWWAKSPRTGQHYCYWLVLMELEALDWKSTRRWVSGSFG